MKIVDKLKATIVATGGKLPDLVVNLKDRKVLLNYKTYGSYKYLSKDRFLELIKDIIRIDLYSSIKFDKYEFKDRIEDLQDCRTACNMVELVKLDKYNWRVGKIVNLVKKCHKLARPLDRSKNKSNLKFVLDCEGLDLQKYFTLQ